MDILDYNVIRDIYNDMRTERAKYRKALEERKNRIKEIDDYLDGMLNKDENDVQVFLARKVENLYREDIEYKRREKEKIAIECDCFESYIHELDMKILKLRNLLSDSPAMLHVKHLVGPSSIDLLNEVIENIKVISSYIDADSDYAKNVLKSMESDISKVIDNFKEI